jgi:tungstate transport system substrate-binding protein
MKPETFIKGFRKMLLKLLIEIENQKHISGNDLFCLLENIMLYGSISRAASRAGVSYRYAWGLLMEAEKALGLSLVDKQVGGYAGGGALLTGTGKSLLHEYKEFKADVDRRLDQFMSKIGPQPEPARLEPETTQPHDFLLMASTLEPVEAGLLDELEDAFFKEKNILVRHLAAGSGKAFDIARGGRVDMVLTHAPELEALFMAEGWGAEQIPVMASDFALAGPTADPAALGKANPPLSITEAFRQIALAKAPFVTRGDHSGTHLRETEIWEKSGITPGGDWYLFYPGVAGNLGALRYAREKIAYMLTDKASFFLSHSGGDMQLFLDNTEAFSPELANTFILTVVNPEKVPSARPDEAALFARWLQKEGGRRIVAEFGRDVYGKPLFTLPGHSGVS